MGLFTAEQMVFALGAWFETDSIDDACQLFQQVYGFMVPRTTLVLWISRYHQWLSIGELYPPEEWITGIEICQISSMAICITQFQLFFTPKLEVTSQCTRFCFVL